MDKEQVITKRIKISGMVQGVGFRPLVFCHARKYGIKGTVRNLGGIVEIIAQASNHKLEEFVAEFKEDGDYEIVDLKIEDIEGQNFTDFKILESGEDMQVSIIPPDLPVCKTCQEELLNKNNRRYGNPFISCTACGPRYTILNKLPYDRHTTTMEDFEMCPECLSEYKDTYGRRFHAQTISCNDCGPYIMLNGLENEEALKEAEEILKSGGILAVKGIGGYHYVCSPFLKETVMNLRKLKGREEKPFAVMFENIDSIKEYCFVSEEERRLLLSKARPIVLLLQKGRVKDRSIADEVNKGGIYCGAFLPYTPLQVLLTQSCGPLIMTSANDSGKPIIREDNEILKIQSPYLKGVLYHKRRILRSVDDSVAKVIDGKVQIIRRSRGYVPYPVFLPHAFPYDGNGDKVFAAGGDLKAAFCLYNKGNAVVSQYFGDLEEQAVFEEYKDSYKDLKELFHINPDLAVSDLHPNYHSASFAKSLGIPLLQVQHHHAHIGSVMAEHGIKGPVIGVAFDGTGYGTDGCIWGSEFMICEGATFRRAAHLSYTPMLGGDSSMRDGKKTATLFLLKAGLIHEVEDTRLDLIKAAVDNKINTVLSSSMGRLFDAISFILGICHENRYEGECATMLEKEAFLAIKNQLPVEELSFAIYENNDIIEIDPTPLIKDITVLRKSVNRSSLALGFHYAVADVIVRICSLIRKKEGIHSVALSGGVFQNTILTKRVLELLKASGFITYMNSLVPPNDGGISLGQTYIGLMSLRKE